MRGLAILCVLTVTSSLLLLLNDKSVEATVAARQTILFPDDQAKTGDIASSSKVTVIVSNLAVRAFAVSTSGSSPTINLTNAALPNRIFSMTGAAALSGSKAFGPQVVPIAGTGLAGSLGDGGLAGSAQFELNTTSFLERSGIAVAPDGTIFIADTGNSTIRTIAASSSSEPGVVRSVAGRWAAPQTIALEKPMGIALDQKGNLYIADRGASTVDVMDIATGQLQTLAHITTPGSIAVSRGGDVLFGVSLNEGSIFQVDVHTRAIRMLAGLTPALSHGASRCDAAASEADVQQMCPAGLAVDPAGNLFVSDEIGGRILRADAKTSAVSTIASGLDRPGEIALDAEGNLYVAEQGLNRIVAFAQAAASQSAISLSPASATFGNEPVGGSSMAQTFTVSNSTAAAVAGLSIPKTTAPADFTVVSSTCTATLAANSSCTLSIAFTPTVSGPRSDTLTVTDSNSSDSASSVLSGTGDDYELQLASGQLMQMSIQAGQSATFNLQVVPDQVFSGSVSLVCPGNLPTNTTCVFSSSSLSVSPGKSVPFQITFQTTGIINPLNTSLTSRFKPSFRTIASILVLPLLILIGFPCCLRRERLPRSVVLVLGILAVMASVAACHSKITNASIGATPPGQTTMSITGNSQNASRAISVTLVVLTQ